MSDCPTSSVIDYIAKLKREDAPMWFFVNYGRDPIDADELRRAMERSGTLGARLDEPEKR